MKITRYSKTYIRGKAAKIRHGQYHLVVFNGFLDGSVERGKAYDVLLMNRAQCRGDFSYVAWGMRYEKGYPHPVGAGFWFQQPRLYDPKSVLDIFPLGTGDQIEADKLGETLFALFNQCYILNLNRKFF